MTATTTLTPLAFVMGVASFGTVITLVFIHPFESLLLLTVTVCVMAICMLWDV